MMTNNAQVQRLYSDILARGRKNAPSFAEVQRDANDLIARIDPVLGFRY